MTRALMLSIAHAQTATLTLLLGKNGPRISPLLHGTFEERPGHERWLSIWLRTVPSQ
jgi:hypothetical protein